MTDTFRDSILYEWQYQDYLHRGATASDKMYLIDYSGLGGDIIALWRMVAYQGELIKELEEKLDRYVPATPDSDGEG